MNRPKLQKNSPRSVRRRTVGARTELTQRKALIEGNKLPLCVRPTLPGVNLVGWAEENREEVGKWLLEHGGILFRGFDKLDVAGLESFITVVAGDPLAYEYASTPRTRLGGHIYSSTEYPPHQMIPLHNEHAYSREWPMKLAFLCMTASPEGGETPIADSVAVYRRLDPAIRDGFAKKGVMYVRNYDRLDLPWQKVFRSEDPEVVEAYCREKDIEFEWKADGGLRTRQVCQAVAEHPVTRDMVWFNQAHLFHVSSLPAELRESLVAELGEENLPRHAYYGDGSPIGDDALAAIRNTMQAARVTFSWSQGDLLLLDNMLAAHGRMPFTGPRKIVVGMAEPHAAACPEVAR